MPVAITARRRLRSVSSADLVVPSTRRSTIGDRAFAVAGPRAWNSLPSDIRASTPSFDTFKKHMKSFLFTTFNCISPACIELVTTYTLTMLGALEVVRTAYCAL